MITKIYFNVIQQYLVFIIIISLFGLLFFLNQNLIRVRKIYRIFLQAISGTEQDFTKGRLGKAIFLLAVPMILEMVMESIFVVVDIYFVSKLGHEAVTAVGITESVMSIVYSIAVGLSAATTAVIARRTGEKKPEKANVTAIQAIITGIVASAFIALIGIFYADELLRLMGADDEIVRIGSSYTSIMFTGNFVIMLLFILNAVFRSSGDAAIAMRVLWFANIINIILDPIFIFGLGPIPAMGVKGAAIATNIGRGLAVAYQLYILFYGNKRISLNVKHLIINYKIIQNILKLSIGSIMQSLIATTSWIVLVRIISDFGSIAVAGYTIAIRVILFALLPAWGLSNASATLVGQNLGAGHEKRAEQSVWISGFMNIAFMGITAMFMIIFAEYIVKFFIADENVIIKGAECLKFISFGFISYALGMIMVQAFNGAGDTKTPMYINLVAFWIIGNKDANADITVEENAIMIEPGYVLMTDTQKADLRAEVEEVLALMPTHGNGKYKEMLMLKDTIADITLQQVLTRAKEFDVVATMNLNGDYLSDALAAQVGGIGIAPGANINYVTGNAIFEATHGTAPKYANLDQVNPGSVILSGAMMFKYMGWDEAHDLIWKGIEKAVANKRVTYDFHRMMDGAVKLKCSEFGGEIISNM